MTSDVACAEPVPDGSNSATLEQPRPGVSCTVSMKRHWGDNFSSLSATVLQTAGQPRSPSDSGEGVRVALLAIQAGAVSINKPYRVHMSDIML